MQIRQFDVVKSQLSHGFGVPHNSLTFKFIITLKDLLPVGIGLAMSP